ncbi:MAG: patatin-like phospholipase family protein [Chloroflexota bacterium]|jgi:NTE family protein
MQYDLVFEGGGAKGMAFVGALQHLEEFEHTKGRLMGTSAGSIMATYIAAGYTAGEMKDALMETSDDGIPVFTKFMAKPVPFTREEIDGSAVRRLLQEIDIKFIPNVIEDRFDNLILGLMTRDQFSNLFSFVERGGWFSADFFVEWARKKLNEGEYNGRPRQMGEMTMAEFFSTTGKELSLVAADTIDHRLLVLNHRTAPGVPVVWAMRMSMSVPLLWQEVIWQKEWGNYMGIDLTGHSVVDGGVLSNFPIELFLSNDPHVIALMGPKTTATILGLLIDESLPVSGASPSAARASTMDISALPVTSRIKGLIDTTTQARDKMVIDAFKQFVCRLPAKSYGTTEFDMTDDRREALIAAGYAAMVDYFQSEETEGMKGPDIFEMEKAFSQADHIAINILQP